MTTRLQYPFFVFEMANNHMGSVEHGLKIIQAVHEVSKDYNYTFGFKLQYRHLETFIHPDFRTRTDLKYIKRFMETRLTNDEFKRLKDEMQAHNFVTVCTPFDERSVDLIEEHDFDVIKVASCSFTDWPLLERIIQADKPILASTAGVPLDDIDKVVSFLEHRSKDFALLHCVAEYPTPDARLDLNQIDVLKQRYPQTPVGYSAHEHPENTEAVMIAIAKGAVIFEKHVGISRLDNPLNAYSVTPDQIKRWLDAVFRAFELEGVSERRPDFSPDELASLQSLRRGVFAGRPLKKGERINQTDVFLAMPTEPDQILANDLSKYTEFYVESDLAEKAPLLTTNTSRKELREKVYCIVRAVRDLLRKSGVAVPDKVELEISHHYGLDRFEEYGLAMLTIVNRAYCKKLIVLLPGQKHPEQYHEQKEETFHVLYGEMWTQLGEDLCQCKAGEVTTVERGVRHSFGTESGVIIEEISSTHFVDDSFYTDPAITQNANRKTVLTYWMDL